MQPNPHTFFANPWNVQRTLGMTESSVAPDQVVCASVRIPSSLAPRRLASVSC